MGLSWHIDLGLVTVNDCLRFTWCQHVIKEVTASCLWAQGAVLGRGITRYECTNGMSYVRLYWPAAVRVQTINAHRLIIIFGPDEARMMPSCMGGRLFTKVACPFKSKLNNLQARH